MQEKEFNDIKEATKHYERETIMGWYEISRTTYYRVRRSKDYAGYKKELTDSHHLRPSTRRIRKEFSPLDMPMQSSWFTRLIKKVK